MITNTATQPRSLIDAMPGFIEASERSGQSQLVNSTQLPVKSRNKAKLQQMGIIFGAPTPGDPLFCEATLPPGWKKQRTDHSMWSEIVDENGVKRANIFYKAAFYDRDAFIDASN